jgi:hypothetical protein
MIQFAQNAPFDRPVKQPGGEIGFLSHRPMLQLPKAIYFLGAATLLQAVSILLTRVRVDTLKRFLQEYRSNTATHRKANASR